MKPLMSPSYTMLLVAGAAGSRQSHQTKYCAWWLEDVDWQCIFLISHIMYTKWPEICLLHEFCGTSCCFIFTFKMANTIFRWNMWDMKGIISASGENIHVLLYVTCGKKSRQYLCHHVTIVSSNICISWHKFMSNHRSMMIYTESTPHKWR